MPLHHCLNAINQKINIIEIKYNMLCLCLTIMFPQQKEMLKVYELDIKFPLFMSRFHDSLTSVIRLCSCKQIWHTVQTYNQT